MLEIRENGSVYFICEDCGAEFEYENMEAYEDARGCEVDVIETDRKWEHEVCMSCLDNYIYCDYCDYYHDGDKDMYTLSNGNTVCEEGAIDSGEYAYCYNCGDLESIDDLVVRNDEYYCSWCDPGDPIIANWHDHKTNRPTLHKLFNENTDMYFGFELEVDGGDDANEHNAHYIRENFFDEDEMYFEEDGSLWDGFEIISQPMSYNFIQDRKNDIEFMMDYLKDCSYSGEDNTTAGLHIHITRDALELEQWEQIAYFLENNIADTDLMSRRQGDMEYCAPFVRSSIEGVVRVIDDNGGCLDKEFFIRELKDDKYNRYHMVNFTNRRTIEFRFFKSTLNHKHFLGSIDLLYTLVMMAHDGLLTDNSSYEDVLNLSSEYLKDNNNLMALWDYAQEGCFNEA